MKSGIATWASPVIDTKLLVLRGQLPDAEVEVFYTTDGSEPTNKSKRYDTTFEVNLGTTVKALVMLNGKVIHRMEERFSKDEGFVFETLEGLDVASGEQAEKAKFSGAQISKKGKGFNGNGYIEFNKDSGFVEWYFENDRAAGDFDLSIRYSSKGKHTATLSVNDAEENITLPAARKGRKGYGELFGGFFSCE